MRHTPYPIHLRNLHHTQILHTHIQIHFLFYSRLLSIHLPIMLSRRQLGKQPGRHRRSLRRPEPVSIKRVH